MEYQSGTDVGDSGTAIANTTTGYFPLIIHGGNMGVETYSHIPRLHITDFIRLETHRSELSSPSVGIRYFDSADNN